MPKMHKNKSQESDKKIMHISKKQLNDLIDKLKDIKQVSTMETAQFDFSVEATKKIKESTRLWRDSWITSPLGEIIQDLEGIIR